MNKVLNMGEKGKPLKIETLAREEIEKIQNEKLKYTLKEAYEHTTFWRKKFDSLGMKPENIENGEDLLKAYEKGLKVTKEDIIKNFNELLPDYIKNYEITFTFLWTSGFGGTPKKIAYTYPFNHSNEVTYFAYNAAGITEGSRVINLTAPPPYSSGMLSTEGLNNYPYKVGYQSLSAPIPTPLMIPIFQSFRLTHLIGLSSRVFTLTKEIKELGVDPASFGVNSIIIGGESSSKEKKKEIEENWNAEVFDDLGSTECSLFAYECNRHNGMHVAETRVFISVVNPESGEIVGEKEEGVDLITNLYDIGEKPGMFLINYSHGDITKILSKERCECGRSFLKIDYPKRDDETINIGGVKLHARDPEQAKSVEDYFSILRYDEGKGKYELEIRVVPKGGYTLHQIEDDVRMAILSSNPAATQILNQSGGEINIKIVEPQNLYEGVKIPPGKPRKLIKMVIK